MSDNIHPVEEDSQIVLYQPDESISLQVRLDEETVWLTQAQMVELFGSSKANISEHTSPISISRKNCCRRQLFGISEQFARRVIAW